MRTLNLAMVCLLLVLTIVGPSTAAPFTVVVLPDTQNYSEFYPEIYDAQTQWIADNRRRLNIRFVSHVGDIVNTASDQQQWVNALNSMLILDDHGIPYGTAQGNHDRGRSTNEYVFPPGWDIRPEDRDYLAHFGPWFYLDEPWYQGASPSGASNYQIITVDGRRFLFLHLEIDKYIEEVAWAQDVLNAHPNVPTVLVTHRYLFDVRVFGARFNRLFSEVIGGEPPPGALSANQLWNFFVQHNTQIFMVLCGHFDGEYRQVSLNAAGLPVYEILTDYQSFSPNGGDGWLRYMIFDPDASRIVGLTYSPWVGNHRTRMLGLHESLDGMLAYADRAGEELELTPEQTEELKAFLQSPLAAAGIYFLGYAEGMRDPFFVLPVDFDAYRADAPRLPPAAARP